ncbi:type IV pilus modification PilV family protein [Chengkuizengella sp. SCS-71B]|uniref:type IV pilus modification PilV family protein n=1 Tax=Chengkuizengella sp. SCS-71B TaxID=3115290 RepID=UPI0032C222BB
MRLMNLIKWKKIITSQNGLSMVEVIGCIAIISIVFISFTTLSQTYLKVDLKQDHKTDALQVAEKVLNELRYDSSYPRNGEEEINETVFSYEIVTDSIDFRDKNEQYELDLGENDLTEVTMYTFLYDNDTQIATVYVSWEVRYD